MENQYISKIVINLIGFKKFQMAFAMISKTKVGK